VLLRIVQNLLVWYVYNNGTSSAGTASGGIAAWCWYLNSDNAIRAGISLVIGPLMLIMEVPILVVVLHGLWHH
jgi:hypothetical protein